jgi:hypothetical protein
MRLRVGAGLAAVVAVWLIGAGAAWGDTITPMCTVGDGSAQPCAAGWYTTPIDELSWTWTAGGTPSNCTEASYQTDSVSTVSCTVSWPSDNLVATQYYTVHVELSSPSATAAPSRPPDSNGWYNHPVAAALSANSFSGIAYCVPTTYAGASTTTATVSGSCVDNAGKSVSATSAPFAYDATPPSLAAAASTGDRSVALSWQVGGDIAPIASVSVVRRAGGDPAATVYRGTAGGYDDTHVRNGVRYTYTITAVDAAGNSSTQTITAIPSQRLLAPIDGARVTSPPTLSWTPVRGATYYNVQLYRGGSTKVLSIWPAHASLQLRRKWRFEGRRYKLKPGRYRWYVWPGFGKRRAARYGPRIGSGTFVMVR